MLACFADIEKLLNVLELGAMGGKTIRAGAASGVLQWDLCP